MKKKLRRKLKINIAKCPKCKKLCPINIQEMIHEQFKITVEIISCAICDTMLNFDRDVKIKTVDESWLLKRGFRRVTGKEK